jgi:hypothetical protein
MTWPSKAGTGRLARRWAVNCANVRSRVEESTGQPPIRSFTVLVMSLDSDLTPYPFKLFKLSHIVTRYKLQCGISASSICRDELYHVIYSVVVSFLFHNLSLTLLTLQCAIKSSYSSTFLISVDTQSEPENRSS